jgi:hypothetical protein
MSLSNWTHWLRTKPPIMAPFFAAPNQHSSFTNVKGTGYAFQLLFEFAGKKLKVSPSDLCLE